MPWSRYVVECDSQSDISAHIPCKKQPELRFRFIKTINVHLYTTDIQEMGSRIASKLSRFPLAGNAVHGKSTSLSQPGAPAVELVTDMLGSTAIISARMSRMG
jgi:hypothetical protein